ncbi:hypothetical protein HDU96_003455 [Phlyctochytrium bullatum]|nr:hypothetical protein HDU96_003455 [Phlyctochytrium bullatum]
MAEVVPAPATKRKLSQLPSRVISSIVDNLKDHSDHVSLLLVCKGWCKTVAEAMYRAPPLSSPDSFERLMGLLNTPLPFLPYPVMIRELDIAGNAADNLYMGDLDAVLGMCPNLEVFRLENCFHISNILIQSLAHHCPNLLQLDLPGCPISDSFVPALTKKCKYLLRLDLSFTNVTIASIHPVILQAESLLELDLSECREADDLTSLDLSNKGFRRPLKSLNLRNTPVNDDLLRFAISQCPELEIIILESCPNITDDAVIKIVNTCTRLRSLDCSFCDRITDLSLNALTVRAAASGGGSLEELYLSACDLITPAAVHQMVQKATRLELLVLDGCEKIMGSYVQEFAIDRSDELECSLEGEGLKALAQYNAVSSLATPPASPARPGDVPSKDGQLRVQVSYATPEDAAEGERRKRKPNTGFAAAFIRNVLAPGEAAAAIAAAKEASRDGDATSSSSSSPTGPLSPNGTPSSLQRRSSRTLRHRRSLLGLSSRSDVDEEDAIEAAKMERQEKIREKRRSRTSSVEHMGVSNRLSFHAPPSPPPGSSALVSSPSYVPSPLTAEPTSTEEGSTPTSAVMSPGSRASASIDETAAKAAFMAALAAKGVKVADKGEEGSAPVPAPHNPPTKRASTLSLQASEFVPITAPTSADPWTAGDAPKAPPARKMSVGTPSGPPTPGAAAPWAAPTGIAQSAVLPAPGSVVANAVAAAVPAPVPATPAAPTDPNGGVLLFSGRAARAASMSKESAPPPMVPVSADIPKSSSPTPGDGVDGSILIASGRRRTRTNSLVQNDGAAASAAPLSVETASAAAVPSSAPPSAAAGSTQVPAWINQPATPTVPPKAPTPWGTDPTVWNNPAQLTSSSSTWSTANPAAPGFVDPWARPSGVLGPSPVTNSIDPWAAAPPSLAQSSIPAPPVHHVVPPSPVVAAPVVQPGPWPNGAAPAAAANPAVVQATTAINPAAAAVASGIRMVATAGWTAGSGPQPPSQPVPPSPSTTGSMAPWGPSVPPSAAPSAAAKAPRPGAPGATAVASRFGSVGMGSRPTSWTGSAAAPVAPAAAAPTANGEAAAGGPKEPFVFSNPKRGRMLLKLKIETKTGGHQTLAVHELDDPVQLATEFVTYWDMAAFKEPLVRLISVRKTNVLRSRGHH